MAIWMAISIQLLMAPEWAWTEHANLQGLILEQHYPPRAPSAFLRPPAAVMDRLQEPQKRYRSPTEDWARACKHPKSRPQGRKTGQGIH